MRAAEAKDASDAEPGNAELRAQADLLAAQAKLFAANAAWDAADRAVQVFGGRGWSTLYRPGRHLHGRARLPHLRGDRRDPEAEDRRGGAGQGVRGVQVG